MPPPTLGTVTWRPRITRKPGTTGHAQAATDITWTVPVQYAGLPTPFNVKVQVYLPMTSSERIIFSNGSANTAVVGPGVVGTALPHAPVPAQAGTCPYDLYVSPTDRASDAQGLGPIPSNIVVVTG